MVGFFVEFLAGDAQAAQLYGEILLCRMCVLWETKSPRLGGAFVAWQDSVTRSNMRLRSRGPTEADHNQLSSSFSMDLALVLHYLKITCWRGGVQADSPAKRLKRYDTRLDAVAAAAGASRHPRREVEASKRPKSVARSAVPAAPGLRLAANSSTRPDTSTVQA